MKATLVFVLYWLLAACSTPLAERIDATAPVCLSQLGSHDVPVVFITGAQSNGQGNAEADENRYPPMDRFAPRVLDPVDGVNIWNTATNHWDTLQEGVNTRAGEDGTYKPAVTYHVTAGGIWPDMRTKYNIIGVGPEYGLARAWQARHADRPLYVVKYTEGGTSIDRWLKSAGDLYPKMLVHKNQAFAALRAAGLRPVVLGFYRPQGEYDVVMPTVAYGTKLAQFYADVASDGLLPPGARLVEAGIPVCADTGTPYANPQNAVKAAYVAIDPAHRYYLAPEGMALEEDEIHWNLATQYAIGAGALAHIFFGAALPLPVVTSAAPRLRYDATTGDVTVVPPAPGWKMREYYFQVRGGPAKRMRRDSAFALPCGVLPGELRVWARAVPGRAASPAATNPAAWLLPPGELVRRMLHGVYAAD